MLLVWHSGSRGGEILAVPGMHDSQVRPHAGYTSYLSTTCMQASAVQTRHNQVDASRVQSTLAIWRRGGVFRLFSMY